MLHRHIRRAVAWLPLAAVALASACKDNTVTVPVVEKGNELPAAETRSISAPNLSSLHSSAPVIATCGTTAVYTMSDGTHNVGKVTVGNDGTTLYVTYEVTSTHWWVSDTRLAVKKNKADIPQDGAGNPSPWDFQYSGVHEPPITSYTYSVSLSSLGVAAGTDVYVAAMSGNVHPVNEANYEGAWEWIVMWGVTHPTASTTETTHTYRVQSCGGTTTPPPVTPPPTPPPTPAGGGIITITFDDGWKTTFTNAYPVLSGLGLHGNVAVNADPIDGGYSDYMTLANLNTLKGAGWNIVSHTMSHRDLTTLSASELDREVKQSKEWVASHGFGPTSVFIVPFHSWGQRERDVIAKYHTYVRGYTIDQFSPAKFIKVPITTPMELTAFEPEFAPFTTAAGRAQTMSNVKYAVDNGYFLDLMFHKITPAQVTAFKDLMTQVSAYKSNIKVWGEVAP